MNVDRIAVGLDPIEPPKTMVISLEEYKELLIIKGKYEELLKIYYGEMRHLKITYPNTSITYRNFESDLGECEEDAV